MRNTFPELLCHFQKFPVTHTTICVKIEMFKICGNAHRQIQLHVRKLRCEILFQNCFVISGNSLWHTTICVKIEMFKTIGSVHRQIQLHLRKIRCRILFRKCFVIFLISLRHFSLHASQLRCFQNMWKCPKADTITC